MAPSPIIPLLVVFLVFGFEATLFGFDMVAASFPELGSVDFGACQGSALDFIACIVGNAGTAVFNVFKILFGVVVLLAHAFTFDIPGAPAGVRVTMSVALIGSTVWSVATLFRGN